MTARARMFFPALAVMLALALPAAAQTTTQREPSPSPVLSGIANMLSGDSATPAQGAAETEKKNTMPLPKDMFFDESTGQYKRVVRGKSGGKYITATTCYEISLESETTRVMRPVACIMPPRNR